jgi:hypothetical protein
MTSPLQSPAGSASAAAFTALQAVAMLLTVGNWGITRTEYQFGRWSRLARATGVVASLCPPFFGTEIVFFCDRNAPKLKWDYM